MYVVVNTPPPFHPSPAQTRKLAPAASHSLPLPLLLPFLFLFLLLLSSVASTLRQHQQQGESDRALGTAMDEATIILVRHGESEGNLRSVMDGQWGKGNFPLTARGRRQAENAGARLAMEPFTAAYSSDLRRAAETARIILRANKRGFNDESKIEESELLRERHLGDWEGTDWPEYNKLTAAEMAKGIEGATAESVLAAGDMFQRGWVVTPPGGESLDQVKKRGQKFFEKLLADLRRHGGDRPPVVLVASHGGTLREIHRHIVEEMETVVADGLPDPYHSFSPNTGVTVLRMSGYRGGSKPVVEYCVHNCGKHNHD